jgi:hypothetical protein
MLTQIVWHESRGNPNVWGDCDKSGIKNGKHCKAFGITQYWRESFYRHAKLANLEHPDWKDTQDQLFLLRWALKTDVKYAREWTGYKALFCW